MKLPAFLLLFQLIIISHTVTAQLKDSLSILNEFKLYRSPSNNTDASNTFFENFVKNPNNVKQYPYFVGMAYEELGLIRSNQGDLKNGIALFDSSYTYAVKSRDSIGMGTASNYIGLSYQYLGLQNLAIEYYLKAYEIGKKTADSRRSNIYISNVASLYFSMGQYENSLKYQRMAIEESSNSAILKEANLARTYVDLSLVFIMLNELDSAKFYNKKSFKIALETNDTLPLADIHLNNYRIFQKENREFAIDELKQGTSLIEEYFSSGLIHATKKSEAYQLNAMQAVDEHNYILAKDYLNKCIELGKEHNMLESIKTSYEMLTTIAEKERDFQNAFSYLVLFKKYSDSLFTIDKERIVQENAIVFETEKKENQLVTKNNELIVSESKLRNRTLLIAYSLILFMFLASGAYFAFRSFKLRKKLEQQQALLYERKRISTELHDDLGAQLSVAKIFLHNLKNNSNKDQDAQLIENSLGMVESSITHLRNIMNELQNTTLEEKGYIVATEELINKLSSMRKMKFNLSHTGMEIRLDKKIEHQLFRATQELINNTLKHADAHSISIDLVNNDKRLVFLFEDDGKGFNSEKIPFGNGLNNITSRMATLNGSVLFDTHEGKGCRTIIEINHLNN